jgi:DNA-binding XRE family transcriptional regulator
MRFIGMTEHGNILIEMSADEWQNIGAAPVTISRLASQVLAFRKMNNMSQDAFASRAGISRNYLSMLETGKEPNLSMDIVWRIREAIDQP